MKLLNPTLFICLILAGTAVFAQKTKSPRPLKEQSETDKTDEEASKTDGLRKISGGNQERDWDFDVHIDEEALEANIESAIENAMRSVEVALERLESLEIHIEPIQIELGDLDVDLDPIEINIPDLNIDIEPVEVDLEELEDIEIDIDIDEDDFDRDNDNDNDEGVIRREELNFYNEEDKDQNKEKDKLKDKSEKTDKEKSKGLKKIKD